MTGPLSWNRLPRVAPDQVRRINDRCQPLPEDVPRPLLAHGSGRSYGDVCLSDQGTLLLTRGLDHFISFDSLTGILRCEAGVTLGEILQLVVPMGWFLSCTPGTRHATLGGAVANDVHGKNHHGAGSFGDHVRALELVRSNGERIECGPTVAQDWFSATVGGLGLTGLITWVEVQLMPIHNPWMWVSSRRFANLNGFWPLSAQAERDLPYTVAWIDCLARGRNKGRGILFAGRHAPPEGKTRVFREIGWRMPVDPPWSIVNGLSLKTFNALYYRQPTHPEGQLSHYASYFYPLDGIADWNRIYGRRGFYQYQCVMPPGSAEAGIAALLEAIARSGEGSFLAVLKTFGNRPAPGMLSFPRPGTTLALDFPNRGNSTLKLFDTLDGIVRDGGGALYPAKDVRMPGDLFRSGFPRWEEFSQFVDPDFSSLFWRRVAL